MTAKAPGHEDPTKTVILVSDTGKVYRLTKEKWETSDNLLKDPAGLGIINQLTTFGAYLSYVPPELAIGIGEVCTVVNLKSILKNNGGASSGTGTIPRQNAGTESGSTAKSGGTTAAGGTATDGSKGRQ
jgi:hypothetical protein